MGLEKKKKPHRGTQSNRTRVNMACEKAEKAVRADRQPDGREWLIRIKGVESEN